MALCYCHIVTVNAARGIHIKTGLRIAVHRLPRLTLHSRDIVRQNPVRAGSFARAEEWRYQGKVVYIDRA